MSIKNVESHIDAVERKLTKSVKIAEKGDGIKLGDIIKLGQKTNSIVSELKKALAQYDGTDPTADEATTILKKMEKVINLTETELALLVKSKARIEELRVGGLVKRNLMKSQEAGNTFSETLQAKTPANLKAEAKALEARRNKAFDQAIGAFANSQGGEDQDDAGEDSD